MPFSFDFHARGFEELDQLFKDTPRHLRGVVAEAASDDLIGTPQRGLKRYPPYKKVTRQSAFGRTFQSVRQQRYVMANIASGRIEPGFPHRRGAYQRSWKRTGAGVGSHIEGQPPHENWPNPLAKKVGWREPIDIIMSNLAHAAQAAERKVAAWFKARGL
jgi:hypothetical protein